MERRYLLGNEAIAHACREVPADFVCGYPGTPSSEVIDTLRRTECGSMHIEWSVNEKVALENAIGASWCGVRALCTMKHVGLNVAADPLMTAAYTGARGGLVILSADDPFAHSSQNEQDSRIYAAFARIPCLDPSSVQEAHDMARDAFSLSEEWGTPVMFRPTTRICHSKGDVLPGEPSQEHREGSFQRDPRQYVVIPAHTRVLHARLNARQDAIRKGLVEKGYNRIERRGGVAVVASGIAYAYVDEVLPPGVSLIRIGALPIDEEWLKESLRGHSRIIVIEELAPVVEEVVRQCSGEIPVHGKKDGTVPWEGELGPAPVAAILRRAGVIPVVEYPLVTPPAGLPPRPPILCAGCMHRSVFHAMRKVFRDAVYPSDIGCYTLGLQLGAVDTCLCMGASVTIASGIAHAEQGRDVVCTIGDSTFLHTGIQGLLNAVYNQARMLVIILDNRITAMTGHQPNPVTGVTACGAEGPGVSLEAICRACGVTTVETADPYDLPYLLHVMKELKDKPGVRVLIARQPCVITARRAGIRRPVYTVEAERCTSCGVCLQFGCPALEKAGEKASITPQCSGCGVCAQICPSGAIIREGKP